ncbi:helicase-related protein [Aneurinibacillus soli]
MPLPHQIEAVYDRMLQSPRVRFLLADDPGAGKTIMSGMLIRELRARKGAERILILTPPLVLYQWQEELEQKFGEEFKIITRATLRENGGRNPFLEHSLCLASVYWAARDDVKSYVLEANFDLIIVDEAHKMAAYTHGVKKKKTKRTRLYQLGEALLRHANHRLLLTATPHKGDIENFRHLMQLIDEDIFSQVGAGETLREKSNPFIIRRLKESMVTFDNTPLFPKRTTQTVAFNMSRLEKELYEEVTAYVREHFNRGEQSGNRNITFAMMVLQRRLSSSVEAVHFSLKRRYEKLRALLEQSLEEREAVLREINTIDITAYEEETTEVQQDLEDKLEAVTTSVNVEELQAEIFVLENLVEKSKYLHENTAERKYVELEQTIFGENGLLKNGEKILIFTEFADTLHYLEKRLLERVPKLAKIVGYYSMDERRRQVELFKSECSIMLATDAGGESINLQFCNQMVNYDIPWNPNKLEQRMGRIHRIGQKNETFVFNLVAVDTREGEVMYRLLNKMEQMREDLGSDLVYDFMGEVIEDQYVSLEHLMQEAIMNRERLDEIIDGLEKTISEEHKRLLQIAAQEKMDEQTVDLPGMKRERYMLSVTSIPVRAYAEFSREVLANNRVKVHEANDTFRIERLPKSVREFARKHSIRLSTKEASLRFTGNVDKESDAVELLINDHPLFQLSMAFAEQLMQKVALDRIQLSFPVSSPLLVEVHEMSVTDGTGRELARELMYIAQKEDGSFTCFSPYWIFQNQWQGECTVQPLIENSAFRAQAIREAQKRLLLVKQKREQQLNKKSQFLQRTFEAQYQDTVRKLTEYQSMNEENRNSALINQMNAQLIEIEERSEERMLEIERERSITLRPTHRCLQIGIVPNGQQMNRLFPEEWANVVQQYEALNGRTKLQVFPAFGLVDFYSETYEGEGRFMILTDNPAFELSSVQKKDLGDVLDRTVLYVIKNGQIVQEISSTQSLFVN